MPDFIELRGVRVHNLQGIDLQIPLRRLTVVTGVAGAGKSSLVFDTLYAESQRRYVQSFALADRSQLEQFEAPAAEQIGFLPPAIAIRRPPRSRRATVGTMTETAYDLQLAFSRLGAVICPACEKPARPATAELLTDLVQQQAVGTRMLLAFEWSLSAGTASLELLRSAGFSRVILGARTWDLRENLSLPPGGTGQVESEALVIVDRLLAGRTETSRLRESFTSALAQGGGECVLLTETDRDDGTARRVDDRQWRIDRHSIDPRCPGCRRRFHPPEPALFQHQSALGACPVCRGTGAAPGRVAAACTACGGSRLQPDALAVVLGGRNYAGWTERSIEELTIEWQEFLAVLPAAQQTVLEPVASRLPERLQTLQKLGLGYLTLRRSAATLSVGESRRVQLAGALATRMVNTLCLIDEPTAGLAAEEVAGVGQALRRLCDAGNTLVVIEHRPEILALADQVIALGPGAGPDGGSLVGLAEVETPVPTQAPVTAGTSRPPRGVLTLANVRHRSFRGQTFEFPLGVLCVVTGVSGSGKTSLVSEALGDAVRRALEGPAPGRADELGIATLPQGISKLVQIDQRPLPRSVRSTAGTILGLLGPIRSQFAQLPEAQARNFGPLHFSFNAHTGGRCPACNGLGETRIDLQFLPDVQMVCTVCHGRRFRREVLDVRFRGLTIAEVLDMNAREAFAFFRGQPRIQRRLKLLKDVGLDYLPLGRSAATLSQGELQRLKLASSLGRGGRSPTLFLLDEPTTGLHSRDVARLLDVFEQLLTAGHSLIVAENHPAVVLAADHRTTLERPAGSRN